MVESMALTVADEQQSGLVKRATKWEIQYSRFFGYLSPTAASSTCSYPSPLSPIKRIHFRGTWVSSATPTAILSLSAHPSLSDFILTISLNGIILEQHYVSKLRFSWPQLSCMSYVTQQSSRVVFVSYKDGASETQKFGLRFSTYYEVGEFVTTLEDCFSNKQYFEDFMITTRSSQSEAKDMLSEVVPTGDSHILDMNPITSYPPKARHLQEMKQSHSKDIASNYSSEGYVAEISEGYVPHISDLYVPEISEGYVQHGGEGYIPVFPPWFTSLVMHCSEMTQGQGDVAASTPTASHEVDLNSLIERYLQDASFLDILSKAEEVIAKMGDGMTILQFL